MIPSPTMPGAEPAFHAGGTTGCLVLHGFTSSPGEVRWLANALGEQGHTVYAPRLPGHGTRPEDLARVRWQDWLAAASDAYHILNADCERVIVVGHSMGGTLALLLAAVHPVAGVALLAAPIVVESRGARRAHWLKYVLPYTDQSDRTSLPEIVRAEQARRGEPPRGRVRYDRWSTAAVAEFCAVTGAARRSMAHVTAPLLLVYSEQDREAPPIHARTIAEGVSSTRIEQHLLKQSGHNLPQDIERETVFELVKGFAGNPVAAEA